MHLFGLRKEPSINGNDPRNIKSVLLNGKVLTGKQVSWKRGPQSPPLSALVKPPCFSLARPIILFSISWKHCSATIITVTIITLLVHRHLSIMSFIPVMMPPSPSSLRSMVIGDPEAAARDRAEERHRRRGEARARRSRERSYRSERSLRRSDTETSAVGVRRPPTTRSKTRSTENSRNTGRPLPDRRADKPAASMEAARPRSRSLYGPSSDDGGTTTANFLRNLADQERAKTPRVEMSI